MSERRLFELWHYGTKRCHTTPRDGQRPFIVTIRDGVTLASQRAFDDHDSACEYAIEQLRLATSNKPPDA